MPSIYLDRIELDLLKVPLKTPYKLAFANVEAFDTLMVTVTLSDGRSGVGDATILTGYTEETLAQCWQAAQAIGPELLGKPLAAIDDLLSGWRVENPFTVTALGSATEMAAGCATLQAAPASVPILAILNETEPADIEAELERLLGAGYKTIKVKVGWNVESDLARVRFIQETLGARAAIRLDANQGYSQEDGCRFASNLSPESIELFEQPCAAGDWNAAVAVKRVAGVPMMLDESIYTMADVEKAAALDAADIIKLKLMKLGSIERLEKALARVKDLGFGAVLGNGVATEVGCWMEACVAAKMLTTAGEMNGFLKPRRGLLSRALTVSEGSIQLDRAFAAQLDAEAIAAVRVARADLRLPAAARMTGG